MMSSKYLIYEVKPTFRQAPRRKSIKISFGSLARKNLSNIGKSKIASDLFLLKEIANEPFVNITEITLNYLQKNHFQGYFWCFNMDIHVAMGFYMLAFLPTYKAFRMSLYDIILWIFCIPWGTFFFKYNISGVWRWISPKVQLNILVTLFIRHWNCFAKIFNNTSPYNCSVSCAQDVQCMAG